jgi:hypothetical protein
MRRPTLKMLRQIARLCLLFLSINYLAITSISAQKDSTIKICDNFFGGISTIFEDANGEGLNLWGLNASYTRAIKGRIAGTGDLGFYFGSQNQVKYSKFQLYAGASLLPANAQPNKIVFTPHLLAGVSSVTSKYEYGNSTYKNSNTNFSLAAGTDVRIPINNKTTITVRGDYNPTFSQYGTSNNIRVGVGLVMNLACRKPSNCVDCGTYVCKASKTTREFKTKIPIEHIGKSIEEIANGIPRVEAKVALNSQATVKQGEECCSPDKPPASYTEIRGGYEGSFEINFNLWGIPDMNYSLKLWPVLLIAEFKCKLFAGPTGKLSAERVGRMYGSLLGGERRPDCRSCTYDNLKAEGAVRVGIKAGGSLKLFHWSPFGGGKAGFDVTGPPDEQIELSAEASVSISTGFNGTYSNDPNCVKPPQGLHGTFFFGKGKANLKFNVKLGPISFDPSYEYVLFDGYEYKF